MAFFVCKKKCTFFFYLCVNLYCGAILNKKKGKNIDRVKGFSMVDIEKAIFATKSLNEMKNNIKNNYPSGKSGRSYTHTDLDKLFDYWLNI